MKGYTKGTITGAGYKISREVGGITRWICWNIFEKGLSRNPKNTLECKVFSENVKNQKIIKGKKGGCQAPTLVEKSESFKKTFKKKKVIFNEILSFFQNYILLY